MSDQHMQDDRTGSTDHPQYRVPEGEGKEGPPPEETGYAQHSTFDGAGNEYVAVTGLNSEGVMSRGFGKTKEEAIKDLDSPMDKKNLIN